MQEIRSYATKLWCNIDINKLTVFPHHHHLPSLIKDEGRKSYLATSLILHMVTKHLYHCKKRIGKHYCCFSQPPMPQSTCYTCYAWSSQYIGRHLPIKLKLLYLSPTTINVRGLHIVSNESDKHVTG